MKERGRRFANRSIEFFDLLERFEARSSSDHGRTAQGAIERLREEGSSFWSREHRQLNRWQDYCNVLWNFVVTDLENRRFNEKQDLETALREFIAEFEHSTHGMFEMLYGTSEDADSDPNVRRMFTLFEWVYRASTYAILACWLDEKHEEKSTTLHMKFSKGERPQIDIGETIVHREMRKPKNKKHRRAMRKL